MVLRPGLTGLVWIRCGSDMNDFKLLDLFCCAGGAGEGYRLAGFDEALLLGTRGFHVPLLLSKAEVGGSGNVRGVGFHRNRRKD